MIGGTRFSEVFGSVPAGDAEALPNIVRAAVRAGLAVVLCRPESKTPMCTLNARERKAAGKHPCGINHAFTDPDEAYRVTKRMMTGSKTVPGITPNVGIELGRSRMVAVDVDSINELQSFELLRDQYEGHQIRSLTVRSPGKLDRDGVTWAHRDGGHFWFTLPEGVTFPNGSGSFKGDGGWVVSWTDHQVLVPPSRRAEGVYELLSEPEPLPEWLRALITAVAGERDDRRKERATMVIDSDDPIEVWSITTSWADLLEDWTDSQQIDNCGCPIWTAPGVHAHYKSATAHDLGCTVFDATTGWGPLRVWTDNPETEGIEGGKTYTKLQYVAARDHGGDQRSAMVALGLHSGADPVPQPADFRESLGDDLPAPDVFDTPAGMPDQESEDTGNVSLSVKLPTKSARGEMKRHVKWQRASAIAPRATRWLWHETIPEGEAHWIALGGLTLLGGREGVGKSTIGYGVAARLTRGLLPGAFYGVPKSVIVAATEDDWAATIVPRLMAADADLDRVIRVDVVHSEGFLGPISMPEDVNSIKGLAAEVDAVMLLLDPLMTVINKKLDTHKDAEVRQALEPLTRLLSVAGIAGVGLIHVNKSQGNDLLTRLMASRAFSAVARTVLFAARDDAPELEEIGETGERFMFGQPKNNLAMRAPFTLGYSIEGATVGYDHELSVPITSSRIKWLGVRTEGIDQVVSTQEAKPPTVTERPVDRAMTFIRDYLKEHGPSPSSKVKVAADAAGHAPATIVRGVGQLKLGGEVEVRQDGRYTLWALTELGDSSDSSDSSDVSDSGRT